MSLQVNIDETREVKRIVLNGSLDSNTSPLLETKLESVLASATTALVFDLAGLEYISSAGLRVMFIAKKAMDAKGGKVLLVNLQPQIEKVFEIIKAIPFMSVFQSYKELDDYLTHMQRRVQETS